MPLSVQEQDLAISRSLHIVISIADVDNLVVLPTLLLQDHLYRGCLRLIRNVPPRGDIPWRLTPPLVHSQLDVFFAAILLGKHPRPVRNKNWCHSALLQPEDEFLEFGKQYWIDFAAVENDVAQ